MDNFESTDSNGNKIYCEDKEVYLVLSGRKRERNIGTFDKDGNFIKGLKRPLLEYKHKFRKNDGWGVNWNIVNIMNDDREVKIITLNKRLSIKVADIKKSNNVLQFSKQGFEVQYIIPESEFKEF